MIARIDGATRYGSSGIAHTATDAAAMRRPTPRRGVDCSHRAAARRLDDVGESLGVGAVHDDAEQGRVLARELLDGELGELREVVGGARIARARAARAAPRALADAAAEHEQHGRAEVRGDARVVGELGGAADVGEVGADDDDGVAAVLDGLEALHDRGERRIGVGVHVVVA